GLAFWGAQYFWRAAGRQYLDCADGRDHGAVRGVGDRGISAAGPLEHAGAVGGGLTVVIWNFSGWENLSMVAGEIENPRRNYARAIAIALPLVTIGYL